jgi:hypothetical protein
VSTAVLTHCSRTAEDEPGHGVGGLLVEFVAPVLVRVGRDGTVAWPSLSLTTFNGTPAPSAAVAHE